MGQDTLQEAENWKQLALKQKNNNTLLIRQDDFFFHGYVYT